MPSKKNTTSSGETGSGSNQSPGSAVTAGTSSTPQAKDTPSKITEPPTPIEATPSQEQQQQQADPNDPGNSQSRPSQQSAQSDPLAQSRTININSAQPKAFPNNSISTAKYSVISFVPSFLFEQFRRYSNIFFLAIALLQQIPDVSPTGRYTTLVPLLFILCVSAIKEIIEDIKRHKADAEVNKREVEVLRDGTWKSIKWSSVIVGDFVKVRNDKFFPADLILFSSSEPQGICYIETSNLDGETNLKIRQALPETAILLEAQDLTRGTGFLECELPNRNLYEFMGRLKFENEEDLAVGPDQVLLRGSKLQNTGFVHGFVVYSGHDTKLMKNSTVPPLKRSTVDKRTNSQIIMLFIMLILISVVSALFSVFIVEHDELGVYIHELKGLTTASSSKKAEEFLFGALTFIILYNNLIPISLTVTLEVVRFIQALFINWDAEMFDPETQTPAMARTSNLNEELGEVSYIFSDKTGTLTRNIMEFKACSVFGKIYKLEDLIEEHNVLVEDMISASDSNQKYDIREFLVLLAICHTVIPDYTNGEGIENVVYHAASPDERALVYGAMKMGFAFLSRTPNHVVISALGNEEKYEIVNVLEFSSARKRMSVVVRGPDGKLKLYCKGADSMIFERLKKSSSRLGLETKTAEHLEEFSKQGLRTLCCAVADLSPKFHEDWEKTFHKAATAIQDREAKMDAAAELIEKNLRLVGSTAIEDKLQDQVPETIAAFIQAGISVWVLTGDKQETAINIGYSCQLLKQDMELLIVNRDSLRKTRECIKEYQDTVNATREAEEAHLPAQMKSKVHTEGPSKDFQSHVNCAVIIDGKTLKFALNPELRKEFLQMCCKCKAVIVCRASPIQKAEIVEYVTTLTGAITLAIGDGANDVAMIQKAHVGIGISGVEGLQAACASDYAISQFRHLKKLLFVHGAWNYDRMCKLIFYSFYKNICLYIIELWFAIYSSWSGQIIFERWTIGLYNMLFTCAQPIAIGLFERNCSQDIRLRYPKLYPPSNNSFSLKMFFVWVLNSILHSITIFWITWYLYGAGIVWGGGLEGGYLVLGNFIYTYVVVVVSLKSGLITKSWTIFTHISIWGSILVWMLFVVIYSYFYALPISRFTLGADMCGIAVMVYSSPIFWIGLIIVPVATLLPDVVVKALETTIYQGLDDAFRECEVLKKDPDVMLKNREKQNLKDNAGCLDSMEDCLTCDSFRFRCNCSCMKKRSKTHPHHEEGPGDEDITGSAAAGSDQPNLEMGTPMGSSAASLMSSNVEVEGAKKNGGAGVKKGTKKSSGNGQNAASTSVSNTNTNTK